MSNNPAIWKIEKVSNERQDRVTAILGEHLPEELRASIQHDIDGMIGDAYACADEMERTAYGLLIAMLPDHQKEIRAAWSVALNPGSVDDWAKYEAGLPLTILPESKMLRLLDGDLGAID